MAKSNQIAETQAQVAQTMLQETLDGVTAQLRERDFAFDRLEERLGGMDMMLDSRGYSLFAGGEYDDDGPTLKQIKDASKQVRDMIGLNSWVKRGFRLRYTSIWFDGIHYANIPNKVDNRSKTSVNVQTKIDDPKNQFRFFGIEAREQREAALYADSMCAYVADDLTKEITQLPLAQITADYRNPYDDSEIWAYRRTRNRWDSSTQTQVEESDWVFRHEFVAERGNLSTIRHNNKSERVTKNLRVFSRTANRLTGWGYGLPDALAMLPWVKLYRDFMVNGFTVTAAMAQIWAVAKSASKGGADAATSVLGSGGKGQIASVGSANELTPLATAGQAYSFEKGLSLIAAAATAIEVSAIAITSDTSAAGSSYGSAQTLDGPAKMANAARRGLHISLDTEVLKWLGATDPIVWFTPYTDGTDAYREVQAILLKWSTGLYTPEEAKEALEAISGREGDVTVPTGVMLPNNEKSLNRKDIDTDGQPVKGSPDQGQNSVAGGGDNANDMRTDNIT